MKTYDLWYTTCSEIAEYFRAYSKSDIICKDNRIIVNCEKEIDNYEISIGVVNALKKRCVLIKNSKVIEGTLKGDRYVFNLKLHNNDIYEIQTQNL
ncbi:hypothetical protein [Aminipila terrae]|uniref:Uncharacterized protein n=1 Tax=Aminipila terrae TaxID=2697030 RepID=A0A6P1MI70_9FIRM|nr:hypothetical protein [Aminipila terrae]QHI71296.1 hypothetical protein Ami3637_01795 [Aminipila terrae]